MEIAILKYAVDRQLPLVGYYCTAPSSWRIYIYELTRCIITTFLRDSISATPCTLSIVYLVLFKTHECVSLQKSGRKTAQ